MSLLHYLAWSSKTSEKTFSKYHRLSNYDLKKVDVEGRSILHLAAQRGNVPIVDYIVRAAGHIDLNHRDGRGRTVIHYGVESRRACDTVTALMAHGANIWIKDYHERSVLHHAMRLGNLPAVKLLLELGMADELRARDRSGMTPLDVSSQHNVHAVLTFLADMERCSKMDEQLLNPGLIGCSDQCAEQGNGLSGGHLWTPAQTRFHALPTRFRQVCHWVDGGRKITLPTSRHDQRGTSRVITCHGIIKSTIMTVTVYVLVKILSSIVGSKTTM